MTDRTSTTIDESKLHEFIGQILGDLGGAFSVGLVRMGEQLGLYKALNENGPMTSKELANTTRMAERYVREWLSHQAASNYLSYDQASKKFALPPEQAEVFAEEDSPVYMLGAFDTAVAALDSARKVQEAFQTGEGVGWGDHSECLFCSTAKFFRPGYQVHILQDWLPALDGVVANLENGARVADVGCLHDMGDPQGAASHIRGTLKGDGTLMVVEPMAGDALEDNLNPVGRLYYGASTVLCVPTSLAQEVGLALGAQAGEARLKEVLGSAGFSSVHRATETAFNMVLECRP